MILKIFQAILSVKYYYAFNKLFSPVTSDPEDSILEGTRK